MATNESIAQMLSQLRVDMRADMRSDISSDLKDLRREFKDDLSDAIQKVNANTNNLVSEVTKKVEVLAEENIAQNTRISRLEIEARKRNFLLFQVEETEKTNSELLKTVSKLINGIGVTVSCDDIDYAHRIGKKSNKTRPILIVLKTVSKKWEIMRYKKNAKGFSISDDLSPEVKEARKKLAPVFDELKKDKRVFFRNADLVVEGVIWSTKQVEIFQQSMDKRKRANGESPEGQAKRFLQSADKIISEADNEPTTSGSAPKSPSCVNASATPKRFIGDSQRRNDLGQPFFTPPKPTPTNPIRKYMQQKLCNEILDKTITPGK